MDLLLLLVSFLVVRKLLVTSGTILLLADRPISMAPIPCLHDLASDHRWPRKEPRRGKCSRSPFDFSSENSLEYSQERSIEEATG